MSRGKRRGAAAWFALSLAWTALIWVHSMVPGPASTSESSFVVQLLAPLFGMAGVCDRAVMTLLVRKCAHFSEYALLGFLTHGLRSSLPRESLLPFGLSVVWAMLAPCLDETIQLFVPGRAGLVTDVLIDLGGVLVGTLFCHALLRRGRLKSI